MSTATRPMWAPPGMARLAATSEPTSATQLHAAKLGMPKRSQEYRDARKDQILAAAKRCFVRNGFHETSMQDLFAEIGLSSGAVYRYFASKEDVILAIAEENLREVVTLLHSLAAEPHGEGIGSTLSTALDLIRHKNQDGTLGPLALLVWAEVLRNPPVARAT